MIVRLRRIGLIGGLLAALSVASSANAAISTITFDEPGISIDDIITNQYADLGATFSGTIAKVKLGPDFNNPFPSDGRIAHMSSNGEQDAFVALDVAAVYLKFEFRRPSDIGEIDLKLFDGANLVHDYGQIGWDPAVTPDWVTFTYDGDFGSFNRVELIGDSKFVLDNLAFGTPVPLPAPALLLATALTAMLGRRRAARN